jgi:hypothetical protein
MILSRFCQDHVHFLGRPMLRNNKVRPFLLCSIVALYTCAISAYAEEPVHAAKSAPAPSVKAAAPTSHAPAALPGAVPGRGAAPAAGVAAPGVHNGLPQQNGHADAAHHDMERHDEHHEMERHEEHREAMREHYEFHGRDVHHFDRAELGRWRGGRWNNSCYAGRCGWWWFSSGQWYFYSQPVYPYPLAVSEVVFLEPEAPAPELVIAPAPPAPPPPAPLPAAPQFWYYCDNPAGYYPAVPSCPAGFREVAAPRQ